MSERPKIDPLLLHIGFWLILSVGLLTAFVVLHGGELPRFFLLLAGRHPAFP